MNSPAPETVAFLLTGLIIICSTVLVGLNHVVPESFYVLGATALGGGAGISVGRPRPGTTTTVAPTNSPPPA